MTLMFDESIPLLLLVMDRVTWESMSLAEIDASNSHVAVIKGQEVR